MHGACGSGLIAQTRQRLGHASLAAQPARALYRCQCHPSAGPRRRAAAAPCLGTPRPANTPVTWAPDDYEDEKPPTAAAVGAPADQRSPSPPGSAAASSAGDGPLLALVATAVAAWAVVLQALADACVAVWRRARLAPKLLLRDTLRLLPVGARHHVVGMVRGRGAHAA
jgi:hypothetical protein